MSTQIGHRRWRVWGALFAGAAWLALFGDKTPSGLASPTQAAAKPPAAPPRSTANRGTSPSASAMLGSDAMESLVPRDSLIVDASRSSAARDLFATANWSPPPAPPLLPAPAPVVAAPPFSVVGKKLEAGQWEVYLMRGDHSFIAREGATIEGAYRIDKITPPNLTMTQLPQGPATTLFVGDAQ